jgi:hypothetical protein
LSCRAPHKGTTYDGGPSGNCQQKAQNQATAANCVGDVGGCVSAKSDTFDRETKSLNADILATMSNLTAFTENMFKLADVGLDQEYLGVFQSEGYPYATCSFNYPYASGNAGYTTAALSQADVGAIAADALVDGYARNAAAAASSGSSVGASAAGDDALTTATKRGPATPRAPALVVALVLTSDVKAAAGLPVGAIQDAALATALPANERVVSKRVKCATLLAALKQGASQGVVPSRNVRFAFGTAGGGVLSATLKTPTGATLDLLQCTDSVVVVATKAAAKA